MEENKYRKHDAKRKRINLSFYAKDIQTMKMRHGKILNSLEIKQLILTGEYKVITRNIDPLLAESIVQLRGIGNNVNQLANLANAKKEIPTEFLLMRHLEEIKITINYLRRLR